MLKTSCPGKTGFPAETIKKKRHDNKEPVDDPNNMWYWILHAGRWYMTHQSGVSKSEFCLKDATFWGIQFPCDINSAL